LRSPRAQFNLRTALAANVLAALACWWCLVRPAQFLKIAEYHRARGKEETTVRYGPVGSRWGSISWTTTIGEWHMMMARKYEQDASRPWMPAGPDPPKPLPGQVLIYYDDKDDLGLAAEPYFGYLERQDAPTARQPDTAGPRTQ